MGQLTLHTERLDLRLQSVEATLARVESFSPEVRAEVSPAWLNMVASAQEASPWIHGFSLLVRTSGQDIGSCGFKGPPDSQGMVEIAYGIEPEFQRQGFATEAARSLVEYALQQDGVYLVCAHTYPDNPASQYVLLKCGFEFIGEVVDPEDGVVLRWELRRARLCLKP
jgi:[ribosomal protein S5]-alanine N-acetyltransferase